MLRILDGVLWYGRRSYFSPADPVLLSDIDSGTATRLLFGEVQELRDHAAKAQAHEASSDGAENEPERD